MVDLPAFAAQVNRSPDELRRAADLLSQGFLPSFLARYRVDETGGVDETTLWALHRYINQQNRLNQSRSKAIEELNTHGTNSPALERQIQGAYTPKEVERLSRPFLSKKNSRTFAERHPQAAKLVELLLSPQAPTPETLNDFVVQQLSVDPSQVEVLLGHARHLIVLKLSENADLLGRLRRHVGKRSVFTSHAIKENAAKVEPKAQPTSAAGKAAAAVAEEQQSEAPVVVESENDLAHPADLDDADLHSIDGVEHELVAEAGGLETESTEPASEEVTSTETVAEATAVAAENAAAADTATPEPVVPGAPAKTERTAKQKGKPNKPKVEAKISPRQRRRRWLQVLLQPFDGLKKPLNRLSSFQIVMLARGHRTQLVRIALEYDRPPLVLQATETLVPSNHPLASWMDEVAAEALERVVLPRVEQDVLADMEEQAHERLLFRAANHLKRLLGQRPIRGHRVLCIDAIGPKQAPLAVVDANGKVLALDEIPIASAKGENQSAIVTRLGELVHQHKVTLIALSNGPARRQWMHAIVELLNQSSEGSLRFTLVDRSGADAYASSRLSSQELGRYGRRQRTPIWLAWRLQDPLNQLLKIDSSRLRLGSYQGELPADQFRSDLGSVVSQCVAQFGVDTHHASPAAIQSVPGVSPEVAKKIDELRHQQLIDSRASLLQHLSDWNPNDAKQAIGFLRIFGGSQSLDATSIHPDDYHLAQRLLGAIQLAAPANQPENWTPPKRSSAVPATSVAEPIPAEKIEDSASTAEVSTAESESTPEAIVETTVVAESIEAPASAESAESVSVSSPSESTAASETTAEAHAPDIDPVAIPEPALEGVDIEKFAKGWQVGREKLKQIATALKHPFHDPRLQQLGIPLLTKVPKLEELQPGMSLWGVIVGLADFGAFADLGPDCQGLIHVSRLATGFVEDPHQIVQIGDLIQVWVVAVEKDKRRVSLSAIPPGTEVAPRPQPRQNEGEREPRGNRPPGRGDSRPQGNRGGNQDRPAAGGNRGGRPEQRGRFRGGGRGDNRRDRNAQDEGQETTTVIRTKVSRDNKPAKPITEAMQKGQEPLRSFSDLMQFYKIQKDDPAPPPETPPPAEG